MKTMTDLLIMAKIEQVRATKKRPPRDYKTYASTLWAWEILFDYLDENLYENPYCVLEAFMKKMEAWEMQAKNEEIKVAFSMAHDNAQMLYDELFV